MKPDVHEGLPMIQVVTHFLGRQGVKDALPLVGLHHEIHHLAPDPVRLMLNN